MTDKGLLLVKVAVVGITLMLGGLAKVDFVAAQDQEAAHIGVASCASSTCHGSTILFADSNILRNEFRTWNENDPHARAYQTLLTDESIRMASKLGLKSAASADACLNCHADNVRPESRGMQFQIEDGVGCEVCHGGAEPYLDSHTDDDHQANLSAGLYPSEEPEARARLCVSCHLGNHQERKITHTMMGAGHPRLSFELNTFSSIQPAHYVVDDDYRERKGDVTELQLWAIGQLVAAQQFLQNVQAFPRSGVFPELVHMDCLGCHQAMSKLTWSRNPLTRLEAGALRYNDAHLMMSYQIALHVSPQMAEPLLAKIRTFLRSNDADSQFSGHIAGLTSSLTQIKTQLGERPINATQGRDLLGALIDVGLASSHRDYAAAEQSAMAINSVLRVLDSDGSLGEQRQSVLSAIESIFSGLSDSEAYRPNEFVVGLKQIKQSLID